MQFITGKHIPRRMFLRGMGATVALPLLDSMLPAASPWASRKLAEGKPRLLAIEVVHGAAGSVEWGRRTVPVGPREDRARLRVRGAERTDSARGLAQVPDDRQQHGRAHGRGLHRPGDRWRPLPFQRHLPDPGASEADAEFRSLRRHLAGPDVRRPVRAGHARFPPCSCASRISIRPAAARTTIRAPTLTRSAGPRPTRRCR